MTPINISDIRLINENIDRKQVYIHLHSTNKPIVRTIEGSEIHRFANVRSHEGMAEAKAYICALINEKYLEPQHIERVQLSRDEERFFELRAMDKLGILDEAQSKEYEILTKKGL